MALDSLTVGSFFYPCPASLVWHDCHPEVTLTESWMELKKMRNIYFWGFIHTAVPGKGILLSLGLEAAAREEGASSFSCLEFVPTTKKPSSPWYDVEPHFCLLATSCNLNKTERLATGNFINCPCKFRLIKCSFHRTQTDFDSQL